MEHTRSRNGPSERRRRRGARRSRSRRRSRLRRSGRTGSGGGRGGSRIEAVSSNRGAAACTGHEHGKTMSVSERTPGPYRVLAVGSVGPAERTWCARKTSRQRAGTRIEQVGHLQKCRLHRSRSWRGASSPTRDVRTLTKQARENRKDEEVSRGGVGREPESTTTTTAGLDSIPRFGRDLRRAIYGVSRVLRASSRCGLPSRIGVFMPQPSGGEHGAS